ncbi:XRE family transcriptional regulator [Methylobacterium sp. W2]|uniref:XRE family transcriptional regulator n=1 Tax=Methylobacterium sp. W2 TaxID=2598107 RepID=UPI001D0CB35E|nr:XRE family transcriptional regulator [Methylobacterium sp. W2]MCC0808311.1 XRE family transcriptional regulator [Methylobacterium sp. W2]
MPDKPIRLTPRLCRAGRAMLGWRQADLAEASTIPNPNIEAFEAKPETAKMMGANMRALVEAFEKAGLEFIPANGGGAGIRFRDNTSADPALGAP